MYIGQVVGCVVSTVKEPSLENVPLLLVQLIENGKKTKLIISGDSTRQAGRGDFVFMIGSSEASSMFRRKHVPVDSAIVGFIDSYNVHLKPE